MTKIPQGQRRHHSDAVKVLAVLGKIWKNTAATENKHYDCQDVKMFLTSFVYGLTVFQHIKLFVMLKYYLLPFTVKYIYQTLCHSLSRAFNIIVLVFLVMQLKQRKRYLPDRCGTGKGYLSQKAFSTITVAFMLHNGCQTLLNPVFLQRM